MLKKEIEKQRKILEDKINEKGDLKDKEVLKESIKLDALINRYNREKINEDSNIKPK